MNNKKLQIGLPLFFSLAVVFGMFIGYKLHGNMPVARSMFRTGSLGPLQEVFELIRTRYVDDVNLDSVGNQAIEEVLTNLDPHSVYIPAKELKSVNEDLAGRFEGIGIEFNIFDDTVHVLTVLKDGPSDKAGLQPGDRILRVGDSSVAAAGITSEAIRSLLRGPRGTKVNVVVRRGDGQLPFEITRGYIPLYALDASYMLQPGTGYIRLNKFSETTYEEFMEALEKLKGEGMKHLVLDLRDNGGGILEEAVEMADEFIDGSRLVVYTEGKHIPRRDYTSRRTGLFEQGKLVLLMNEGSASASEVLAGALQDWDRATVVGRRSFGKGLVQEQYNLRDGSALRLTVARYYTPLGRSIQKPYTEGNEKYNEEILDRYTTGKLANADSNLKTIGKAYRTKSGKTVYGGGGISPDIFVPIDTLHADTALYRLYRRNTIGNFAYRYYVSHLNQFSIYKSPGQFREQFSVDDAIIQDFQAFAAKDSIFLNGLSPDEKQTLGKRIKSMLARQRWRNDGYFEVVNQDDPLVIKAIEAINKN
jgi:carboxyl-terminal processing protease